MIRIDQMHNVGTVALRVGRRPAPAAATVAAPVKAPEAQPISAEDKAKAQKEAAKKFCFTGSDPGKVTSWPFAAYSAMPTIRRGALLNLICLVTAFLRHSLSNL